VQYSRKSLLQVKITKKKKKKKKKIKEEKLQMITKELSGSRFLHNELLHI